MGMTLMKGWKTSGLPELLRLMKSGGTPDTTRTDFYGGDIPFVSIEDMTATNKYLDSTTKTLTDDGLQHSNAWIVPDNSILYSIYATLGLPRINTIPVATNQAILALIIDPNRVDLDYLYYWLDFIRSCVVSLSSQTTQNNLNATIVRSFLVDHPTSVAEQSQIADILSTVDLAIEQTEALIAKQQRIKTGSMQDLLTRGIDEHGNLRSEPTHQFKDSPVGRIPVEWEVVALGSVSEISSGITLGKSYSGPNTVELPYLRVANVQDGYLDLTDVKLIRIPKCNVERYELRVGDVLMNEGGDFDKLGRGCVWNGEIEHCLHQNHVFKVRPKQGLLASDYLAAVSSSPYGKSFFVLASKQSTNLASINSTQLKSFPIPLPEYCEQLRIEKLAKQYTSVYNEAMRRLSKLRSLKTALMQDLLTGKVRVTPLLDKMEVTDG